MMSVTSVCSSCSKNPCKWASVTVVKCSGFREKDAEDGGE